jgi:hypothetical protein
MAHAALRAPASNLSQRPGDQHCQDHLGGHPHQRAGEPWCWCVLTQQPQAALWAQPFGDDLGERRRELLEEGRAQREYQRERRWMAGLVNGVGCGALGIMADKVAHVFDRRADRPITAGGPGERPAGEAGERVALGHRCG